MVYIHLIIIESIHDFYKNHHNSIELFYWHSDSSFADSEFSEISEQSILSLLSVVVFVIVNCFVPFY